MKYTRVKAVTCALTASVMIFGSAAHTNAAGVSHDLPAAGVALVLEEGSSLSGAQEEAGQGGQAPQQESAGESQETSSEAPAVTSEDIEAGATGVGEASIDTQVAEHVEDQQVQQAIESGVGVASVLNTEGTGSGVCRSGNRSGRISAGSGGGGKGDFSDRRRGSRSECSSFHGSGGSGS